MKLKIKEAINSCGSGATQPSNIGAYKRDSIDMLPKNVRRKPRPKDFEVDLDEGYDNPFTNAKQKKAFDDACDCIHNGYGKMYWKKNYRNGLDVSQIDEIWNKAYKYMNESVKKSNNRKRLESVSNEVYYKVPGYYEDDFTKEDLLSIRYYDCVFAKDPFAKSKSSNYALYGTKDNLKYFYDDDKVEAWEEVVDKLVRVDDKELQEVGILDESCGRRRKKIIERK